MASRSSRMREPFDQMRLYSAAKYFTCNGKTQAEGAPFDKQLVTLRKLRQLYDGRYLRMLPVDALPSPTYTGPIMPNFPLMSEPKLREWLAANGRPPNPRATHTRLAARAIRRWHELNQPAPVAAPKELVASGVPA